MHTPENDPVPATAHDVERLLGPLDTDALLAVLNLSPTLKDVEEARLRLAGEDETLPKRHQPHRTVLAIIELLSSEDEDERRAR